MLLSFLIYETGSVSVPGAQGCLENDHARAQQTMGHGCSLDCVFLNWCFLVMGIPREPQKEAGSGADLRAFLGSVTRVALNSNPAPQF